MRRGEPRMTEIHTKVAGVTHDNDRGRIKSRQKVISRFCRDGSHLQIQPEPDNPHSANALGVWVQALNGVFFRGKFHQVGYVPQEDADEISEWLDRSWTTTARIWKVVGGDLGQSYGLRIDVFLDPPGWLDPSVGNANGNIESVQGRKIWRLPSLRATTAKKLMMWGSFGMSTGLGFIALGWLVGSILGRLSDILGLGVVMAAVGAGLWGVGFTFSTS